MYVLVAVSFSICWGVLNILNFSIPALFMIGGFGMWALMFAGMPWFAAVVVAVLIAAGLSYLIERLAFRYQRNADPLLPLVSSLGFLILIENVVLAHYGSDGRAIQLPFADTNLRLGSVVVGLPPLIGLVLALALVGALQFLVRRTRLGRGVRAVAENPGTATLLGVELNTLIPKIFIVTGLFTGLAGAIFAMSYLQVSPFIGDQVALKGVSAMVLGGMGNIWGAVVGGLIIGLVEVFSTQFLSADFVIVVVYGLLLFMMIVRPSGIFGDANVKQEKL
jgi:branched-chain amino acid transport system permease protein